MNNKEKLIIITYQGFFSNRLVEALLNNDNCTVIKIVESGNLVGNKTLSDSVLFLLKKTSLLILITKGFEFISFYIASVLVNKERRKFQTLEELSQSYHIPLVKSYDINRFFIHDEDRSDTILFSISYYQIVNQKTLSFFKDCYNVHPAPLPEGRGLFPAFWLLLYPTKNNRYYQTIHKMIESVDKGMIVSQDSCPAPDGRKTSWKYMSLVTDMGCTLLKKLDFRSGIVHDVYVSGVDSVYSYPKTKDVVHFLHKGNLFFDSKDIGNAVFKEGDKP